MAESTLFGDPIQESTLSFPAAMTTGIPVSVASLTAASSEFESVNQVTLKMQIN